MKRQKYIGYKLETELWHKESDSLKMERLKMMVSNHWNRSNNLKFALESILYDAKSIDEARKIAKDILDAYKMEENKP